VMTQSPVARSSDITTAGHDPDVSRARYPAREHLRQVSSLCLSTALDTPGAIVRCLAVTDSMALANVVLFDLFETLVTEPRVDRGLRRVASMLGIPPDLFESLWARRQLERYVRRLDYGDVLRAVANKADVTPAAQVIQELCELKQADTATCFAEIRPDVLAMLDELTAAGFRLGVITNCSMEAVAAFEASELADRFDTVVTSCDSGMMKPHPAIYRFACSQLAMAGHGFFVGDGGSDELRGAAAVGLRPLWATWFADSWPAELWAGRRSVMEPLRYPEVSKPADVAKLVIG
jgi:FMN phosphatase YigB (HAD superfamily)